MNLNQIRLLVALGETGSLSRAADRLGMTQSGASQALTALEADLGACLATRQRRGIVLTRLGQQVLEQARRVVEGLTTIRQLVDAAQGIAHGRLRLGCLPSFAATLLPDLLRVFAQRHPGIRIVAVEGTDDEVAAWLAAGRVDIGVVCDPSPQRGGVTLCQDEWLAVVPSHHRWVRQGLSRVALAAVAEEPFVLATGGCSSNARTLFEAAGLALHDLQLEVRDWNSALTLVGEGLGVALVPSLHLPRQRQGWRALALETPCRRQLGLELANGDTPVPGAHVFIDTAVEVFAETR
ncbi:MULTISPECIES: LysR family transcriptional regulator [unclassified Modicisalibacter]|uniref:LysR family transcriptional regulator n=1 Tax=unclassified Modicisalibacter TaxID=2679913 RepID=UPI001CCF1DC6|nr:MULTISPECIES: LysR family transcriptional regulator [unclassified Modicisalibacter]MBZ9559503.1 LysR family transcriptional regulator [Modicisalibacter sp. R2A 31.J]MBZ9576955.1 LysR family transcriptional regulator [Modicisalibacter sp. MOD 31.J]